MLLSALPLVLGLFALVIYRWHRKRRILTPLFGPSSTNYLTGHFKELFGPRGIEFQDEVLKTYGPTVGMDGIMRDQFIFTFDPGFIHTVLVKDRSKFDRGPGLTALMRSMFGGGLVALRGNGMSTGSNVNYSTQYSRGNIFANLPVFTDVAKLTCQAIDKSLSGDVIDVIPWTSAAALETIGEAGLGYSFDAFSGGRNEYNAAFKGVGQLAIKLTPLIPIYPYLARLPVTRNMLSYIPFPLLRRFLKATSHLNEQAEQIIHTRKDMLARGVDLESVTGRGKDILTQLIKANDEGLDREAMIGHMNIFISAGHETSKYLSFNPMNSNISYIRVCSSMIVRILEILSQDAQIQDKLRNEVLQCKEDDILELPYLDAVVKEALRLYSPATFLARSCTEDTIVPLSYPVSTPSGTITSLPVKKGTFVALSITFSNRDEKIWGKRAGEFWPDRWLVGEQPENPGIQSVYSSMLTFGLGQYSCIGFKFAVAEIKVMIAQLLSCFKFEPSGDEYFWEGSQSPFLVKERGEATRVPKLLLKVSRL